MRCRTACVVDVGLKQHRVACRFVELDIMCFHQIVLERRPIVAGRPAHEGQSRRVEHKLVGLPGIGDVLPADTRIGVFLDTARPVFGRDHLGPGQDTEVFRDQRVVIDLLAQAQCQLDLLPHQPVPL